MRIPVIPLLYSVSAASLCGVAWNGYDTLSNTVDLRAEQTRIGNENRGLKKRGMAGVSRHLDWNYHGKEARWFWEQFAKVNLMGKAEEEITDSPGPTTIPPEPTAVDLTTLIELACIMHAGDNTGVVVRYLVDVDVPEALKPVAVQLNTIPRGRRPNRSLEPVVLSVPVHHLQIGQPLWPPFEYAVLSRVAADASMATFEIRIEEEKDEQGNYRTQTIRKTRLVSVGNATGFGAGDSPPQGGRVASKSTSPTGAATEDWTDLAAPVIRRQRYEITTRHMDYLGAKAIEHVTARSYDRPDVKGIEVRNLSSHAKKFGVNIGDVVLSLNGIPVKTLAGATRAGTRLHKKGVWNFRIVVLRRGREMTLTYAMK